MLEKGYRVCCDRCRLPASFTKFSTSKGARRWADKRGFLRVPKNHSKGPLDLCETCKEMVKL